ncbi:hypothetical protein WUBG_06047, partial [Wuchereria bancrofti]
MTIKYLCISSAYILSRCTTIIRSPPTITTTTTGVPQVPSPAAHRCHLMSPISYS